MLYGIIHSIHTYSCPEYPLDRDIFIAFPSLSSQQLFVHWLRLVVPCKCNLDTASYYAVSVLYSRLYMHTGYV